MEATYSSETLVDFQWTTRYYTPEDRTHHKIYFFSSLSATAKWNKTFSITLKMLLYTVLQSEKKTQLSNNKTTQVCSKRHLKFCTIVVPSE
jgi:hypothetical protein